MRKILIVLIMLLTPISFLVFHDKGNELLKPYLSAYLESKLLEEMQVDVKYLKIDLNHVKFNAFINERTHVDAQGELSLFTQTLNINYSIKSNVLKNKVNIKGTLTGTLKNMDIQGKGEILKSKINYTFNVKNDLFNHIKITINKADIASLLELTAQAPYATGKIDINIDIENLNQQSINSSPQIVLHETVLNQKVFKQKLQIDLPSKTILTGKLNAKFSAKSFQLQGIINSNLGTLKLSKTYYNIKTKELSSDYILLIPKLSKLITSNKQKLQGKLEIIGTFQRKNSKVYLAGKTKNLGGKIVFKLRENKLNIHMNTVDIGKLLHLFGEKPYITGKIIASIKLNDLKKVKGTFNLKTKEAKTVDHTLRKESNLNFGKDIYFTLSTKGNITPSLIKMEAKLHSDIFKYNSSDIEYEFHNKALSSTYLLYIPKLSKLNRLTGKTLRGELSINGKFNHQREILITGNSKNLGGNIDFKLKAKKLNAKIDNISVEKLMKVLSYPQVFKAKLIGDFNYDLSTSSGKFNSTLNQAELLNTYIINVIKKIRGVKLSQEPYHQTYFNATFQKNLIDIDFKAKSKTVLLSIPSGQINIINNSINAYYKVKIDNKNLEGKIKGDISDPKITLNSSKFIQNNMMYLIEENMDKGGMGDFGMGKKETNVIKDMMNSFFR